MRQRIFNTRMLARTYISIINVCCFQLIISVVYIDQYYNKYGQCLPKILNISKLYYTKNVKSLVDCLSLCLKDVGCQSVNSNSSFCGLSTQYISNTCDNGVVPESDVSYYEKICLNGGLLVNGKCQCKDGFKKPNCRDRMIDCRDGWDTYSVENSWKEYGIEPVSSTFPVRTLCWMRFEGRTYVQVQLHTGNVMFNRNWNDYKYGFGDISTPSFWIGNENLHLLTARRKYNLVIQLVNTWYSQYGLRVYYDFNVADESKNYRMTFSSSDLYNSHTNPLVFGDSLLYSNNSEFSTFDRDNDLSTLNCAMKHGAGWWYKACTQCNPNGRMYLTGSNIRSGVDDEFFWDSLPTFSAFEVSMFLVWG